MIEADKRKAVFLLHQEGMPLREIARRLHLSRNTVGVIIAQGGQLRVERFDALIVWWATERALTVRLWGACAAIFGGLTAYGIMPREAR